MAVLTLEIATADGVTYSGEVDVIVAPGVAGQFTVLPNHAPFMTMLEAGELMLRQAGAENFISITGGFMEVLHNHVTVLADAAERAEEIDVARATAAKERAETLLKTHPPGVDLSIAEAALRRSMVRLKTAEHRLRRKGRVGSA